MVNTLLDILPAGSWGGVAGQMRSNVYFPLTLLCWALAGIFGLVAALRVYALWNLNGRSYLQVDTKVYAWIGAAIFFILAKAFIKALLG
ncbi:DUF4134 family protein [Niabella sp. CJ426]|uniref:DUF4134 family protein n=1 Tax=Niabella sp. CJ426 TaxID=3393740 RepID=UPI003D02F9C3